MPHVVPNTNITYIGSPYQGGWGHIGIGECCIGCMDPLGYGCTEVSAYLRFGWLSRRVGTIVGLVCCQRVYKCTALANVEL